MSIEQATRSGQSHPLPPEKGKPSRAPLPAVTEDELPFGEAASGVYESRMRKPFLFSTVAALIVFVTSLAAPSAEARKGESDEKASARIPARGTSARRKKEAKHRSEPQSVGTVKARHGPPADDRARKARRAKPKHRRSALRGRRRTMWLRARKLRHRRARHRRARHRLGKTRRRRGPKARHRHARNAHPRRGRKAVHRRGPKARHRRARKARSRRGRKARHRHARNAHPRRGLGRRRRRRRGRPAPLPSVLAALEKSLSDPSPLVRKEAVAGLFRLGRHGVFALIRAARSKHARVRKDAVIALGRLGHTSALPVLRRSLSDRSGLVRKQAVSALSRFGRKAIPALLHALTSKDARVRRDALIALSRLDSRRAARTRRQKRRRHHHPKNGRS